MPGYKAPPILFPLLPDIPALSPGLLLKHNLARLESYSEIMRMQTNPKQLIHIQISFCCPYQQWVLPPIRRGSSFTPLKWTHPEPEQPFRNSSLLRTRCLENSDGALGERSTRTTSQIWLLFFSSQFVREKGVFNLASPTNINFANKSPVTARYFVQKWF